MTVQFDTASVKQAMTAGGDVRAAKRLKYGAEKLGQERGWEERQNGRLSHRFASFHRETRKCARALPATLPEAVQNSRLPKEPFGTIAGKFSYFSLKEGSATLPWVPHACLW